MFVNQIFFMTYAMFMHFVKMPQGASYILPVWNKAWTVFIDAGYV